MVSQYPSSIRWWNPPVILFFSWVEMHEIMRCKFSGARPESYKSTVEVALGHSWSVFSCALLCIFLRFGVDFCTTFWLLSRTKTVCHSGQKFQILSKILKSWVIQFPSHDRFVSLTRFNFQSLKRLEIKRKQKKRVLRKKFTLHKVRTVYLWRLLQ